MTHANGNGNGSSPIGLTKKDFSSDQETRWCPGCGDYAILATVQQFLPELGLPPERIVFVAGIGCAGRFASTPGRTANVAIRSSPPVPGNVWRTPVTLRSCGVP